MTNHLKAPEQLTRESETGARRVSVPHTVGSILLIVAAGVGALTTALMFATWVGKHNAIYYRAVEVGRVANYPSGHYPIGIALGLGVTAASLVGLLAIVWLLRNLGTQFSRAGASLAVVASVALALGITGSIVNPYLGGVPIVVGITLAVLSLSIGRDRT
jgi:hypothetical protein